MEYFGNISQVIGKIVLTNLVKLHAVLDIDHKVFDSPTPPFRSNF